jgi:hypothetical protein
MYIWVDGICINQTDFDERAGQVALMPKIYARCKGMIVWLGEHTAEAIDWRQRLKSALSMKMGRTAAFEALLQEPCAEYQDCLTLMAGLTDGYDKAGLHQRAAYRRHCNYTSLVW